MYEWLKINGIEPEEFEESEYDINLDISYDFFIRIISREHKTLNENETLEIKIGELKIIFVASNFMMKYLNTLIMTRFIMIIKGVTV